MRRRRPGQRAAAAVISCLVGLLALPALAGAAASTGCNRSWPVLAYRAQSGAGQPVSATLPIACGVATGYATSETTLAVSNSGAIFFSPANSENSLARSTDQGATWSLVAPPKLQYTSLWNTVDPAVVVDRQTGRVFWVHTTYTEDLRWPLPEVLVDAAPGRGDDCIRLNLAPDMRQMRMSVRPESGAGLPRYESLRRTVFLGL